MTHTETGMLFLLVILVASNIFATFRRCPRCGERNSERNYGRNE